MVGRVDLLDGLWTDKNLGATKAFAFGEWTLFETIDIVTARVKRDGGSDGD